MLLISRMIMIIFRIRYDDVVGYGRPSWLQQIPYTRLPYFIDDDERQGGGGEE